MSNHTMLINSCHTEDVRIGIIEDGQLVELEIESNRGKKLKGNIYKAAISRIEPSLQAAFINIGTERNGFLQINDIHPSYFQGKKYDPKKPISKAPIQDLLYPGQELIVQVVKEERGLKGATLTTYLSLPGRYVVLMPGSDRGGVSRKINDSDQRLRLKKLTREMELPAGIGLIIRTAGLDRSQSELTRDVSLQLKLWEQILEKTQTAPPPFNLYEDGNLSTRVIRDYFTPDIREIFIDDENTFNQVKSFVGEVMPRYRSRIKLYEHKEPIFSHYNIEDQVNDTTKPEVQLKSGGAIVIDSLEALVAIDVNSGKATAGDTIEETAYKTNLEAAEEVGRQLRLRDLGGLIVIDFIDMLDKRHRATVEQKMEDVMESDKARIEIGRLSKFGLMEMSRQRLRASLSSQVSLKCPTCQGTGRVKNTELVALTALRKIQGAVIVGQVSLVKCRLSPAPALFLLNNKKKELAALETKYGTEIYILPDGRLKPDEVEYEMDSRQSAANLSGSDEKTAPTERKAPSRQGRGRPAARKYPARKRTSNPRTGRSGPTKDAVAKEDTAKPSTTRRSTAKQSTAKQKRVIRKPKPTEE